MTPTQPQLDPKVIHWAANTLAMPFPFQDAYIGHFNATCNVNGKVPGGHGIEQRREEIRGLLESGGLSSLACLSKKELRLLYDGLSRFLPTVQKQCPLKRSALKGQMVQQLGTLLTDPTIIESIQTKPIPAHGTGIGSTQAPAQAPGLSPLVPRPVPTPTQLSTPTMYHQLPYPYAYPYPSFLSPFQMPMPMLTPIPAPTLHSQRQSTVRQPMSAQVPLPPQTQPQTTLSLPLLSRKRKEPSNSLLSSSSPPAVALAPTQASSVPALHSACSPPPNDSSSSSSASLDSNTEDLDDDPATDPADLFWIQPLQACGFQDEQEIRRALQRARQQGDPITLENLICDIITAREDSALARDMDEARRQSEMEHQQELQRLCTQRAEETQQRLLNASLQEFLNPPPQSSNIFFPRSWLLRHPPLQSLLEDITNHHMEIKKELIQLLQLEKNAFRWYSTGIAKSYFTHHLAKVLGDLDISLMATKLQEICHQLNEAHALLSKQNSSGIPLIYIQAQQEYPILEKDLDKSRTHDNNDRDDDDDDEVQVLDDEQVQKLKATVLSSNPTAPIVEVDADVDVDEEVNVA